MKPLIVVYSLLMMLFCYSCGSGHPARRVTEEKAYEGFCRQVLGLHAGIIRRKNTLGMATPRAMKRMMSEACIA